MMLLYWIYMDKMWKMGENESLSSPKNGFLIFFHQSSLIQKLAKGEQRPGGKQPNAPNLTTAVFFFPVASFQDNKDPPTAFTFSSARGQEEAQEDRDERLGKPRLSPFAFALRRRRAARVPGALTRVSLLAATRGGSKTQTVIQTEIVGERFSKNRHFLWAKKERKKDKRPPDDARVSRAHMAIAPSSAPPPSRHLSATTSPSAAAGAAGAAGARALTSVPIWPSHVQPRYELEECLDDEHALREVFKTLERERTVRVVELLRLDSGQFEDVTAIRNRAPITIAGDHADDDAAADDDDNGAAKAAAASTSQQDLKEGEEGEEKEEKAGALDEAQPQPPLDSSPEPSPIAVGSPSVSFGVNQDAHLSDLGGGGTAAALGPAPPPAPRPALGVKASSLAIAGRRRRRGCQRRTRTRGQRPSWRDCDG